MYYICLDEIVQMLCDLHFKYLEYNNSKVFFSQAVLFTIIFIPVGELLIFIFIPFAESLS